MSLIGTPERRLTARAAEAVVLPRQHILALAVLVCIPVPLLSLGGTAIPLQGFVKRAIASFAPFVAPVLGDSEGRVVRQGAVATRALEVRLLPSETTGSGVAPRHGREVTRPQAVKPAASTKPKQRPTSSGTGGEVAASVPAAEDPQTGGSADEGSGGTGEGGSGGSGDSGGSGPTGSSGDGSGGSGSGGSGSGGPGGGGSGGSGGKPSGSGSGSAGSGGAGGSGGSGGSSGNGSAGEHGPPAAPPVPPDPGGGNSSGGGSSSGESASGGSGSGGSGSGSGESGGGGSDGEHGPPAAPPTPPDGEGGGSAGGSGGSPPEKKEK